VADMAPSFEGMVFSVGLWGSWAIDMSWLDGMTGCVEPVEGGCIIAETSVTFTDFKLID